MELMHPTDIEVIDDRRRPTPLTIGVSTSVALDFAFTDVVRSNARAVRPAFDPDCDLTLVDVGEMAEGLQAVRVIAVAASPSVAEARAALGLGAVGILDRRGDPDGIGPALLAAAAGVTVLPPALAPALVTRLEEPPPEVQLAPADLELLRDLASGMRLDDVALVRDRSTRTIRRDLRDLWARMGASGRAQGLVLAARWGLVD